MFKDHWSKNKDIVILKVALPAKLLLKLLVNLATVTIAYLDIKFIKCLYQDSGKKDSFWYCQIFNCWSL